MKCQICKVNAATIHFKQIVDGEARELMVCEPCALENGFDVKSPLSMTDFLFGMGMPESGDSGPNPDLDECPGCGMTSADFRKGVRLGCVQCYDTFRKEIEPQLRAMHKGIRHVGKVPAVEMRHVRLHAMQRELETAVQRQDFEEAARLRDDIQALRDSDTGPVADRATDREQGA